MLRVRVGSMQSPESCAERERGGTAATTKAGCENDVGQIRGKGGSYWEWYRKAPIAASTEFSRCDRLVALVSELFRTLCVTLGYTEGVRFFLENGADINAAGGRFGTPLQTASSAGFTQIVCLLLSSKEADLHPAKSDWISPLEMMLLIYGAITSATKGTVERGFEAACKMSNTEVVRLLLKNGANGNTAGREFGRPLKAAVGFIPVPERGNPLLIPCRIEIIKLLLDDGADVNAVGGKYGGVLPAACAGGTREIVQLVLDKEADVAAAAPIPGKLRHAKVTSRFMAHQTEVLSLLLANGADANSTGGKYGSPLCAASSGGHHELVVILLDHGADVNNSGSRRAATAKTDAEIGVARRTKGAPRAQDQDR
ncbi:ankyrin repeat-containing domain protein [Mycena galericulata]|nr:ankyrin repeat-containing domain protein [Mycena galericulata]